MLDLATAVDHREHTVSAAVFTDPDVYELELERVFGRSWLYVGHTSQVAAQGDFVAAQMGRDPVILCRGRDDKIRVFLNSCPHKAAPFCRQDRGNTKSFICPYHSRTFDTSGKLVGIAGAKLTDLDPRDSGALIEVPRVESFEGLVFANFDAGAVSLADYLGDMRFYLEVILAQAGESRVVFEGVHRWMAEANWKFPAEQFTGDPSHQYGVHRSMGELGFDVNFGDRGQDFVVAFANGHGLLNMTPRNRVLSSRFQQDLLTRARARLQPAQAELLRCLYIATVFPNFSLVSYPGFLSVRVWQPAGPGKTEIWSSGVLPADAPESYVANSKALLGRYFSPSGVLEQDDVEVWESCQKGVSGPRRRGHRLSIGIAQKPLPALSHLPGRVGALPSEHANFGFFERWHALMGAT